MATVLNFNPYAPFVILAPERGSTPALGFDIRSEYLHLCRARWTKGALLPATMNSYMARTAAIARIRLRIIFLSLEMIADSNEETDRIVRCARDAGEIFSALGDKCPVGGLFRPATGWTRARL
jgi:hypothetical protein